jgi:hypothetical protein
MSTIKALFKLNSCFWQIMSKNKKENLRIQGLVHEPANMLNLFWFRAF